MIVGKETTIASDARVRLAVSLNEDANQTAVQICVHEHALRLWQAYEMSYPKREVATALVRPKPTCEKTGKKIVLIDDVFPGRYLKSGEGSGGITADTFSCWSGLMAARYTDSSSVMLGWAHSHPNIKIFMSQADVMVHQAAFSAADHLVALITDPHKPISASRFFAWEKGQRAICDVHFEWPAWCDEFGQLTC